MSATKQQDCASRDMTRAQFNSAVRRNGFSQTLLWFTDLRNPSTSYGGILDAKSGKLNRRATLAHILRSRQKHEARAKEPTP